MTEVGDAIPPLQQARRRTPVDVQIQVVAPDAVIDYQENVRGRGRFTVEGEIHRPALDAHDPRRKLRHQEQARHLVLDRKPSHPVTAARQDHGRDDDERQRGDGDRRQ